MKCIYLFGGSNFQIITEILKYLTFKKRKNKAFVNKLWHNASLHPKFTRNETLVFNFFANDKFGRCQRIERIYDDPDEGRSFETETLEDFINTVKESKRKILNLKFTHVPCMPCLEKTTLPLFSKRGLDIKTLYFSHFGEHKDILSNAYLTTILSQCRNLETLSISGYEIVMETYDPQNSLLELKCLNFCFFKNTISDTSFEVLMKHAPNLNALCLDMIDIDPFIYNSYGFKPNALKTYLNVINYLKTAQKITTLKVDILFNIFIEMSPHIKLKVLQIDCSDLFKGEHDHYNNFKMKLEEHQSLEKLSISNISCCLLSAILKLQNLKHLKINYIMNKYCSNYTVCLRSFLNSLSDMKHMKKLSIDHELGSGELLFMIPGCTLSLLTSFVGDIRNVTDVLHYGKNLLKLTIYNGDILTTSDLQLLFNNLTNIRYLQIDKCTHFKDNILTKLNLKGNIMKNYDLINVIFVKSLHFVLGLITLKISGASISHRCLRDIKHTSLKVLHIDNILLNPFNICSVM